MTEQLPITDVDTATQAETTEHEALVSETQAAAEGGHAGGVVETLGINAGLFVSQLINFALVFLVIWFLILKPLTKKLEERRKIIDESLDRAKEIETRMVMADAAYEEKIKEARTNADSLIAKAHEEAKILSEKMKQDTKNEIATLVTQAKEKIQSEKEATIQEIRTETAHIAVAIAEKIIGQTLDNKKDEKFIQDLLSKMK